MLPLKTKDGEEQLVIKTAAFNKDWTPRTIQNEKIRFFCERLLTPSLIFMINYIHNFFYATHLSFS